MATKHLEAKLDGQLTVAQRLVQQIDNELEDWKLYAMDRPFYVRMPGQDSEADSVRIDSAIASLERWKDVIESEIRMLKTAIG